MRLILVAFLYASALVAQVPDAPKPQIIDQETKLEWRIAAAAHVADYRLTLDCIQDSSRCHEAVLPNWVTSHHAALGGVEVGMLAVQVGVSYVLRRRHHTRIAKWFDRTATSGFVGDDAYLIHLLH